MKNRDILYPMKNVVAIMKVSQYEPDMICSKISAALSCLNICLPVGKSVLLKPNIIGQNTPSQCTTTHPAVVDAVCRLLSERSCRIVIGESSAFYQKDHTMRGFKTSGIEAVALKYGAELVAFERDGVRLFSHPDNRILPSVLLCERFMRVDYIINLPKLKTHAFFQLSGAVKNLFGFVPGGTKYEYHFIMGRGKDLFGEKLVDIFQIVKPSLHIMDAVWGLEGFGPAATGKPKHTGLILLSDNPFAMDFAVSGIIGYDPYEIASTKAALKRGLLVNPEEICFLGDIESIPSIFYEKPKPSKKPDNLPKERDTLYKAMLVVPTLLRRRCSKCGICVDVCPVQAVYQNPYPTIDRVRCLNCYHCSYRCPEKALPLRGGFLNKMAQIGRRIARL